MPGILIVNRVSPALEGAWIFERVEDARRAGAAVARRSRGVVDVAVLHKDLAPAELAEYEAWYTPPGSFSELVVSGFFD